MHRPRCTATLQVGSARDAVSMTRINQQIAGGPSGSAETTGTDSFVASVPARAHDVGPRPHRGRLQPVASTCGRSQRLPPSPIVLYRDSTSSTVTGTAAAPFSLAFTNPADGYSSSDNDQVSSATLTWFAPDGSGATPSDPAQAFLVVALQSSYPSVPYGQPNSGHFFSSFTPLPGNRLTFTPTGGAAVTGTSSTSTFSSTNAASDDDGIFDAVYWFSVPATTTGGTLTVTAGPATGTEYTGFTGTRQPGADQCHRVGRPSRSASRPSRLHRRPNAGRPGSVPRCRPPAWPQPRAARTRPLARLLPRIRGSRSGPVSSRCSS